MDVHMDRPTKSLRSRNLYVWYAGSLQCYELNLQIREYFCTLISIWVTFRAYFMHFKRTT